jgi:uncharacterized membrane protein
VYINEIKKCIIAGVVLIIMLVTICTMGYFINQLVEYTNKIFIKIIEIIFMLYLSYTVGYLGDQSIKESWKDIDEDT